MTDPSNDIPTPSLDLLIRQMVDQVGASTREVANALGAYRNHLLMAGVAEGDVQYLLLDYQQRLMSYIFPSRNPFTDLITNLYPKE